MMKIKMFFEHAQLLGDRFGIIPLLYGSVGLGYITNESLDADDIDVLIPAVFLNERWDELRTVLTNEGYVLVDEHEHTFRKNDLLYSYASMEELESFADIPLSGVEQVCHEGIKFKVLSLEQYLNVYRASVKDGYRITVRKKKDNEKIEFIEARLKRDD